MFFLFVDVGFFYVLYIHLLILNFPSFSHYWENRRCKARLAKGVCMVRVDFVYPLRMKVGFLLGGFCKVVK